MCRSIAPLTLSAANDPRPLAEDRQRATTVCEPKLHVLTRYGHLGSKKDVATNRLWTKIVLKVDCARFQETLGVGALLVAPRAVVRYGRAKGAL